MTTRRIVGIDLGVTSSHTVVVIDETTAVLARRRCRPTLEGLETIEQSALAGAPASTVLEVIVEPTGAAWLPVVVFFMRRGHVVHRVSSAKASAMRRFLSQHSKANSIDAEALARLAIVGPEGLQPLRLPEGPAASLDRRVRAADRLTDAANSHKVRLRELARQAMPMIDLAIRGELGVSDVAVLERYGDPRQLLRAGRTRLVALIHKTSRGHHGEERGPMPGGGWRRWRSSSTGTTRPCRSRTWPPRWRPRPDWSGRSWPSGTHTPADAKPHTGWWIPKDWPAPFPVLPTSVAR